MQKISIVRKKIDRLAIESAKRPRHRKHLRCGALFLGVLFLARGADADCGIVFHGGPLEDGYTLTCSEAVSLGNGFAVRARIHLQCYGDSQIGTVRWSMPVGWSSIEDTFSLPMAQKEIPLPGRSAGDFTVDVPVPDSVCEGHGDAKGLARSASIRLDSDCPQGGWLKVPIVVDCSGAAVAEVYVGTVQVDDDPPDKSKPELTLFANVPSSGRSGLDPGLGFRKPMPRIFNSRHWSLELAGSWQQVELTQFVTNDGFSFFPGVEDTILATTGVEGDLFTLDLNLLYRTRLTDRLNVLAFGSIGWSFLEGVSGTSPGRTSSGSDGQAFALPATGLNDGELIPSVGVGLEYGLTDKSVLDLRYAWRPETSPLDDSASSQLQLGLGYDF